MCESDFGPYRVRNSGRSLRQVLDRINKHCFIAPGIMRSIGMLRTVVNPLHAFERFVSQLAETPNAEFVTFREAFTTPRPTDKIRVVMRHDVDRDIVAAERHARIEQGLGIPATYFILHTSPYYGLFDCERQAFCRNECMGHYYLGLQEMGHEIALHNDALWVYQQWLMDGAQALVEELNWLRSCGLDICGSVAHHYLAVYGAENYEVFKGTECLPWEPTQPGDYKTQHEVCCKGRKAPLRILKPSEFGLIYEGNDLTLRSEPPVEYGSARFVNHWYWTLPTKRPNESATSLTVAMPKEFVDEDTLLRDLSTLSPGTLVVLNIHPIYYGCRFSIAKGPPKIRNRLALEVNEELGWQTYAPGQVQCYFKKDPAHESRQNISWANEVGMLDKPWSRCQDKADLRILILGSDTLDARHVMVNAQCQALLEWFFQETLKRNVFVFKLAFAQMGVDRLWPWYEKVKASWKADIVILGIDGDALGKNLPEIWSQRTGFSAKYPPGDYLSWDPVEEKFQIYPRSRGWRIRQSAPRSTWRWPRGGQDIVQTLLEGTGFWVDGCDCLEYLDRLYGFVIDGIRQDRATPILLLEGLGTYPCGDKQRVAIEPASEKGKQIRARLAEFAGRHGVDLIDPYCTFEADPWHRRPTQGDGSWTYAGHRMAAESIFEHLQGLPACRRLGG